LVASSPCIAWLVPSPHSATLNATSITSVLKSNPGLPCINSTIYTKQTFCGAKSERLPRAERRDGAEDKLFCCKPSPPPPNTHFRYIFSPQTCLQQLRLKRVTIYRLANFIPSQHITMASPRKFPPHVILPLLSVTCHCQLLSTENDGSKILSPNVDGNLQFHEFKLMSTRANSNRHY
jgi:hypothetical protein